MRLPEILKDVGDELKRAKASYKKFHSAHEGFCVLKEEVDELWEAVRMKQFNELRPMKMKNEAIQVAAMALRFLQECC